MIQLGHAAGMAAAMAAKANVAVDLIDVKALVDRLRVADRWPISTSETGRSRERWRKGVSNHSSAFAVRHTT